MKRDRLKQFVFPAMVFLMGILFVYACGGFVEQKYIDYDDSGADGGGAGGDGGGGDGNTDGEDACVAALTYYTDNVSSGVEDGCMVAGCHDGQAIGGENLVAGAHSANREIFLAFGMDALYLQYTDTDPNDTHSGGNMLSAIPQTTYDAWNSLETACAAQ